MKRIFLYLSAILMSIYGCNLSGYKDNGNGPDKSGIDTLNDKNTVTLTDPDYGKLETDTLKNIYNFTDFRKGAFFKRIVENGQDKNDADTAYTDTDTIVKGGPGSDAFIKDAADTLDKALTHFGLGGE